jgi:hypothetical protein
MESVPLTVPVVLGVKVTLMVQLAPDARLPSQEMVPSKFDVATILAMFNVVTP